MPDESSENYRKRLEGVYCCRQIVQVGREEDTTVDGYVKYVPTQDQLGTAPGCPVATKAPPRADLALKGLRETYEIVRKGI